MSEENKDLGDETFEDTSSSTGEPSGDFSEETKQTYGTAPDNGKTVAIIAHITLIGWIIALIMNSQDRTELGSFYIRQTLGIYLIGLILGFIPFVGCFAGIICLVLLIMSLINAVNRKTEQTPYVGSYFQDWFSSL